MRHPPSAPPLSLWSALMPRQPDLLPSVAVAATQLQALPRRVRRAVQRQWRLPLMGIALLLALGQQPVQAATIPVGGACTLVDAITAANTDTATGGCHAGSGADTIILPAGSTQTLTTVNNDTYGPTGLPVIRSVITIEGQGSTIARDHTAPTFRLMAVHSTGDLTLNETTVSGGVVPGATFPLGNGGGVANFGGTATVLNSTITGNAAPYGSGGGVLNRLYGTLTVTNSTISSNAAGVSEESLGGGGVLNSFFGTITVTNSTIVGNSALSGGGLRNLGSGPLTLARIIVSGNTAAAGPEINTPFDTVTAANHNLFGVNGTAGVEGFTPGATDIVPPTGTQLADILDPTLTNNGGPTQTHALVPGSLAIDAGGTDCTDANGDLLLIDQRGRPRVVDGNSDGTGTCDIGSVEFFPIVNDRVVLVAAPATNFDPTPVTGGLAGTFTITATFTNTSTTPLRFPFFGVSGLSGGNLVLNADGAPGGVGATVTPQVDGDVLAAGASMTGEFVIGLQEQEQFTFLVNVSGELLVDTGTGQAAGRRGAHPRRQARR